MLDYAALDALAAVAREGSFEKAAARLGVTPSAVPFKVFSGENFADSHYRLEAGTCPDGASGTLSIADCVLVSAIPKRADPAVDTLTMTSTGVKSCTGTALSANRKLCWP